SRNLHDWIQTELRHSLTMRGCAACPSFFYHFLRFIIDGQKVIRSAPLSKIIGQCERCE
ncbi:hypothetical protein K443DRAFT_273700, partial [Laccaria amethystina LaAM-08-1]